MQTIEIECSYKPKSPPPVKALGKQLPLILSGLVLTRDNVTSLAQLLAFQDDYEDYCDTGKFK